MTNNPGNAIVGYYIDNNNVYHGFVRKQAGRPDGRRVCGCSLRLRPGQAQPIGEPNQMTVFSASSPPASGR